MTAVEINGRSRLRRVDVMLPRLLETASDRRTPGPVELVRRAATVRPPIREGEIGSDEDDRVATGHALQLERTRQHGSPDVDLADFDATTVQPRPRMVLGDTQPERSLIERRRGAA